MVNGRVTAEQMDWLQERAEEVGGNFSAALRQAITDARLLEHARAEYTALRQEHPEFGIPRNDDGSTRVLEFVLSRRMSEVEDLGLREAEVDDAG